MAITETPKSIKDLDLMKRLDEYSKGSIQWGANADSEKIKDACAKLHADLCAIAEKYLVPLMTKANSGVMERLTLHDATHSLKTAHIMWNIISEERRNTLTPPEIGLLVTSAFFHDIGLLVSENEVKDALKSDSEMWNILDIDPSVKENMENLKKRAEDSTLGEDKKELARRKIDEAERLLLFRYFRDRHAEKERIESVFQQLEKIRTDAKKDGTILPDISGCLSFCEASYKEKLIDICVSHNQETEALVGQDPSNHARKRFVREYHIGPCKADLLLVAAALRLADVLDFDSERTPSVLQHYILPGRLKMDPEDENSVIHWRKQNAIASWEITDDQVIYNGECHSYITHHAIVEMCAYIEEQIKDCRNIYDDSGVEWPFSLPSNVKADITEHGYTYRPYKFELEDRRIFDMLMGESIYSTPLAAVRELIQNAVDACSLQDAMTKLYADHLVPAKTNRIFIRY